MAAPKKQPPIQSPLVGAFNNIVNINRSRTAMRSTQSSFDDFLRFMSVEVKNIEAIKLPDDKKVKKLANINVANTFGRPGSLLSSLFSGALDLGSFLGNTFGGRKPSSPKAGGAIPKGKGIRLGGFKALGVANAAFAGLDFATGLAEGESVGKAAAGAGGALAGSMLGGAIGQALIPVPGVGFMIGSALGGMAGGWLGDRAHEAVTGEGKAKDKQEQKLQELESKQKAAAAATVSTLTFPQVLDKFDSVVLQFEKTVSNLKLSSSGEITDEEGPMHEEEEARAPSAPSDEPATENEFTVSGGQLPSKYVNTPDYGEKRPQGHNHQGEDYPIPQGTPISLVVPGTVAQAGFSGGAAGGNILITHEDKAQTRYLHMSAIHVKAGDKVSSGQVIGLTGGAPGTKGAGRSSGPHLHLEYYKTTTSGWSDPKPHADRYFRFGGNVTATAKPKQQSDARAVPSNPQGLPPEATAKSQTPAAGVAKPSQDLSKMSTDQLKGMLDPTKTAASNPAVFRAAQEARTKGQESGLTGEDLERAVMIASIRAKNAESQVAAMSQQPVQPQQLQQYPTYSQPSSTVTIIPMMMGAPGGGSQQRPMVVSSSGGGGGTTIMPSTSPGQVLNSLMKTVLLTNLSGS